MKAQVSLQCVRSDRWLGALGALCLMVPFAAAPAPPEPESAAYVYRLLNEFGERREDGWFVRAGVTEGSDGLLYGATVYGGAWNGGTVYRIAHPGSAKVVDSLDSIKGTNADAELVADGDGNLYGTGIFGGTNDTGTVFRLSADGAHTVLHDFGRAQGVNTDGAYPRGLCLGPDGNLYGLTQGGGAAGGGVAFRITPAGEFTKLHDFNAVIDGVPAAALILGPDGSFYGTGVPGPHEGGTVFRMTASGDVTVLHAFPPYGTLPQPYSPSASLAANPDGDLFGTTALGGAHYFGTVFKLSLDGVLTVLHSFDGADGRSPMGPVTYATDGHLYGTASVGGPGYSKSKTMYGVVFTMLPDGSAFRVLHGFAGPPNDGNFPTGRLLQASDGRLYGTTEHGGSTDSGTVFSITPR
jgi:uncharacterized repeat protein (TIGR03803 family)